MERSSRRGKIPQQDWPLIITRHEAGETLASIARTYDCSPPAISYIVSRSRARNAALSRVAEPAGAVPEVHLVKAHAQEPPHADSSEIASNPAELFRPTEPAIEIRSRESANGHDIADNRAPHARTDDPRNGTRAPEMHSDGRTGDMRNGTGNGFANPSAAPSRTPVSPEPHRDTRIDQRRTLHLSMGQASAKNGTAESSHQQPDRPTQAPQPEYGANRPYGFGNGNGNGNPAPNRPPAPNSAIRMGADRGETGKGGVAGAFIDDALRERVNSDCAAFLAAFDAALSNDSPETRTDLREATDRLLRAGARTRIELERLEARIPLPPRDQPSSDMMPAWRR